MNLYFGLFCSAGVLFNSSEIGFDFFCFCTIMLDKAAGTKHRSQVTGPVTCILYLPLTKKLEEKTIDSYPLYVRLFGFYTQQNLNSAANFGFTSKTGLPHVVLVLPWV